MSTRTAEFYMEVPLKMKFIQFVLVRLVACVIATACLWNVVQLQNAAMNAAVDYSRDWYTVAVASITVTCAGFGIPVVWLIFFSRVRRKFTKYTNAGWVKKY